MASLFQNRVYSDVAARQPKPKLFPALQCRFRPAMTTLTFRSAPTRFSTILSVLPLSISTTSVGIPSPTASTSPRIARSARYVTLARFRPSTQMVRRGALNAGNSIRTFRSTTSASDDGSGLPDSSAVAAFPTEGQTKQLSLLPQSLASPQQFLTSTGSPSAFLNFVAPPAITVITSTTTNNNNSFLPAPAALIIPQYNFHSSN
mmetsp:Transcript_25033/g.70053  ORF Transcript_25033/g.70053 Transcript_25033/m.70053 type:complete len:204 (-) Transcript_25033:637-1248(-)